jgi:hypothetical protein
LGGKIPGKFQKWISEWAPEVPCHSYSRGRRSIGAFLWLTLKQILLSHPKMADEKLGEIL